MPYKLIPPGKRHGNKVYYARISVRGKRAEVSTGTRDKELARRFAEDAERRFYDRHVLGASPQTVGQAIDAYIAWRRPRIEDERYLLKLKKWLGNKTLSEIGQADIDEAARLLLPNRSAETWNRQVYTPISAVMKHAGIPTAIRRPRQRRPRNKALSRTAAETLIASADHDLAVLLTVMFFSGSRITEAISLTWDRVDLNGQRLCFDLGKTDEDHWRPMHPRVFTALANMPNKSGRVFPWRTRSWPSRKMTTLAKSLGITFHPHMARHSFATWLADAGTNMRDIMDAGGWSDHKSVLRYTGGNVERLRSALNKL